MTDKEFIDRMKRAKSKVKDGISATIVDVLPEDREYAMTNINNKNYESEQENGRYHRKDGKEVWQIKP